MFNRVLIFAALLVLAVGINHVATTAIGQERTAGRCSRCGAVIFGNPMKCPGCGAYLSGGTEPAKTSAPLRWRDLGTALQLTCFGGGVLALLAAVAGSISGIAWLIRRSTTPESAADGLSDSEARYLGRFRSPLDD